MENNSKDVLEKQITSMLNNVIGDEEHIEIYDELNFSDENDNNDNIFNIPIQDCEIRNTKSHHKNNNNFYNDDENIFNINNDFQIRYSKTHHHNYKNNFINFNNKKNKNIIKDYRVLNNQYEISNNIPIIYNNNLLINNNDKSIYKKNNFNSYIINNYYNNNYVNTLINTKQNQNLIQNNLNSNSPFFQNKIPNQNQNLIQNNMNYIHHNRTYERKKTYDIKKNTLEKNTIEENSKFGTVLIPNKIDLKLEILIYEMKKLLMKIDKIDYYIFNKLQGNIILIIKTNKGSRIFQNYLKNTQCDILHQILTEISSQLNELLIHPYANYFCRKFFTFLNQKDRIEFLSQIKNSLYTLCTNNIGTFPIQGIIEYLGSKSEKNIILNELKDKINQLSFDPYGSHVIEKIISCFEEEYISFIYKYIIDNFLILAFDSNGICIIKKIVSLTHKVKLHEQIKNIVKENSMEIIKHTYGNFIIQSIIENWDLNEIKEIINLYIQYLIDLSMEKFASNVIERCIERDSDILLRFINDLVNSNRISELMKDNYGNFVVQKALKLASGYSKNILIMEISNNVYKLNNKKLIYKWKSLLIPYLLNNDIYEINENLRNE